MVFLPWVLSNVFCAIVIVQWRHFAIVFMQRFLCDGFCCALGFARCNLCNGFCCALGFARFLCNSYCAMAAFLQLFLCNGFCAMIFVQWFLLCIGFLQGFCAIVFVNCLCCVWSLLTTWHKWLASSSWTWPLGSAAGLSSSAVPPE